MYSNLAEILLNSVPVLPSSASLAEFSGFLQELGGDWKVLIIHKTRLKIWRTEHTSSLLPATCVDVKPGDTKPKEKEREEEKKKPFK